MGPRFCYYGILTQGLPTQLWLERCEMHPGLSFLKVAPRLGSQPGIFWFSFIFSLLFRRATAKFHELASPNEKFLKRIHQIYHSFLKYLKSYMF
jgi:hypothetical protein